LTYRPHLFLELLSSCPWCGSLVFARAYRAPCRALTVVWDPSPEERRTLRQLLGPRALARQGFASVEAKPHECPPDSPLRLLGRSGHRREGRPS
jgi:hypothetical protein